MNPKYLFHCTRMADLNLIIKYGLTPGWGKIQSKGAFSYFCKESMVGWAIAHVAVRHHCAVESLAVIRFTVVPKVFTKYFGNGLYRTDKILDCSFISYHSAVKTLFMIETDKPLSDDTAFPMTMPELDAF